MENDSLLLGRIKEIHKYRIIISLPHNKSGICSISAFSEEYNSLLSRLVNDDSIQNDVSVLKTLFTKGQIVQVKMIKSLNTNKYDLSMMPSAVNCNISPKQLKNTTKLQVAIRSREDKGYILETGIAGLNGFLPLENCSFTEYSIGQLLSVYPIVSDKGENRRVMNFSTTSKLKSITISSSDTDFGSFLPGSVLKTTLKKNNIGMLQGKFNGFTVTVRADHHRMETDNLSTEQLLCIIGVDCALKQLDCSMLQHLQTPFKGSEELLGVQIGHSEKNCIIRSVDKNSIILDMPNMKSAIGIIDKAHIDHKVRQLSVGDAITARFLDYNLIDNALRVTTLSHLLAQSYFSINQARLGEMVKVTVKKFSKAGYTVQISSQLSGLIPIAHLSDKPIRNPQTLYKSGEVVQCRVFHIDIDESRLLLTIKKSLMNSTLPVVSCFDDFQTNMVVNGFVSKIMEFGLVVVLFNNIRGWLPISRIPESLQKSLPVSFFVGKPLEVRLLRWNEASNKIELSLLTENDTEEVVEKILDNIKVGHAFEAEVKQAKPNGFNVRLMPINRTAFLPFTHLSDSREHRTLLQAHFTLNTEIKIPVVVIESKSNVITVSKKQSLISASESGRLLISVGQISVGSQWLGWVSKKESYGMFIDLPSGVTGLVRNKDICDQKPMKGQISELFEVGDTVQVKVLEIDKSRSNKCLFSLKMSETYRAAEHMTVGAIDFMKHHLEERKFIKSTNSCQKVQNLEIGDLVNVEMKKQCEWGFTLKVKQDKDENIVAGFVRNQHLPDSAVCEGGVFPAIIIDIDLKEQSVEVCMSSPLVNAVTNRKNHCTRIEIGQSIASDVMFFNNDFVVAALKGHAHGNMVFIPTKRFWNDVSRQFAWIVNQRNSTIIKTVMPKEVFIGSLAINEAIELTKTETNIVHFKDMSKKIKIKTGAQYPVFFSSISKHKLFVHLSRKQKALCDLTEYSTSLKELEQLMAYPPEFHSFINKTFTIIDVNKKCKLASGHFLEKSTIEEGDLLCCRVISCFSKNIYRMKLPLGFLATLNLSKVKKIAIKPRVGSIIQCKVQKIVNSKIALSMISSETLMPLEETEEDNEQMEIDEEQAEDSESEDEEEEREIIEDKDKDESSDDEGMPKIVRKSKIVEGTENLTNVYKRAHESDDENEVEKETSEDEESEGPIQAKKTKIDQAELEIQIRRAEKRRETGENINNPLNQSEFELLVLNRPNDSNSWIKFMRFVLDNGNQIDKARSIAERAMKTIQIRDAENRFRLMKEYVNLEIAQLVVSINEPAFDVHLARFRKVFERGLTQKAKLFYEHVCGHLLESKLFDLAEEIAKRFIKEFHHCVEPWFQLFLIRFLQKKFSVVKETIVNAERSLKAADYRELTVKMAVTEIEVGDADRGVQMLLALFQNRPKDTSLKNRIAAIFNKHDLSQHVSKLDVLSVKK